MAAVAGVAWVVAGPAAAGPEPCRVRHRVVADSVVAVADRRPWVGRPVVLEVVSVGAASAVVREGHDRTCLRAASNRVDLDPISAGLDVPISADDLR